MTIKSTQTKGFSITNGSVEAILESNQITLVRLGEDTSDPKSKFEITGPGEYEIGGLTVLAYENFPAFSLEIEGFTVVYLPQPTEKLTDEEINRYGHVDLLLVPGKFGALAEQLAPPIVIPLNDGKEFAESIGSELPENKSSFTIKSSADLPEETEIVNLGV